MADNSKILYLTLSYEIVTFRKKTYYSIFFMLKYNNFNNSYDKMFILKCINEIYLAEKIKYQMKQKVEMTYT